MSWRSRVQVKTLAVTVAGLLCVFALGFAGFAIYLSLLGEFFPHIAAMMTALIYILAAIIVLLGSKLFSKVDKQPAATSRKKLPENVDEIEGVLQRVVDPAIGQWVKNNPTKSVIATLVAGVVFGTNDDLQNSAKSAVKRFMNDR